MPTKQRTGEVVPSQDAVRWGRKLWEAKYGRTAGASMEAVSSIVRVRELLIEFMDRHLDEVGMNFGEYDLLAVIDVGGTMPLGKIRENARRYFNHQTSATNVVQRLADRGLVSMRRDRNDGRVTLASLTSLGKRRLARAHEILASFEFGLEGLSKAEQSRLNDLLFKVRVARGDLREIPDDETA